MKANDPAALKALKALGQAYAVIYLPGETAPMPVTTAGEFRGRPFFMLGTIGHWIGDDLKAVANESGVAYFDDKGLRFYVTPAANAPEVQAGLVVQAIDISREQLAEGAGMAAAILAMDPDGTDPAPAPRPGKPTAPPDA